MFFQDSQKRAATAAAAAAAAAAIVHCNSGAQIVTETRRFAGRDIQVWLSLFTSASCHSGAFSFSLKAEHSPTSPSIV